jgi:hypothetical protein
LLSPLTPARQKPEAEPKTALAERQRRIRISTALCCGTALERFFSQAAPQWHQIVGEFDTEGRRHVCDFRLEPMVLAKVHAAAAVRMPYRTVDKVMAAHTNAQGCSAFTPRGLHISGFVDAHVKYRNWARMWNALKVTAMV